MTGMIMSNKQCYIPPFYFSKARINDEKRTAENIELMNKVSCIFGNKEFLTEYEFQAVTEACNLPRYMNLAFFRAIDALYSQNEQVTFEHFKKSWSIFTREIDKNDIDTLIYYILKKPENDFIVSNDFLPILEDIILNHPALQFLENNIAFQERYIETVICRIFYDAHCPSGNLTLKKFLKSKFSTIIRSLTPTVDLYTVHNIFSYKQFYVLYCKLWSLDTDHDLIITETDLCNYNMGALARLAIERIMKVGHIMAFTDPLNADINTEPVDTTCLTYFDFIWFLLSEVDKSTAVAIEYWFRCLDIDGDGIISGFELSQFWKDQDIKYVQHYYASTASEGRIKFEDIMRQMNDLILPDIPGQFTLKDLKKNGYLAERFFDTFINFDRFQVHESHQEGAIREHQDYEKKKTLQDGICSKFEPLVLTDYLGFPVLSTWNDYTDFEYNRIIMDENYVHSYEEEDIFSDKTEDEDESILLSSTENHHVDSDGIISITHDLQTQDLLHDDVLLVNNDAITVPSSDESQSIMIMTDNIDLSNHSLYHSEEDDSSSSSDGIDTSALNSPILSKEEEKNSKLSSTSDTPTSYFEHHHIL
ncbi:uncharacterized protein BX663DRAFT_549296 [Cokeromyces recurvatus]|uniref:uncharacterized protein n=1 Tax=Cokeromyces recurvatus TaxID=90255 RepID=UPI00221EECC5|nr:uncharacterized protein BX663DRAFT_549296 [Cokeromyces recurvatus]KAI7906199.1 hypothetical protein BX663DRAFT_549296 [Cokeromyces recurvatus]